MRINGDRCENKGEYMRIIGYEAEFENILHHSPGFVGKYIAS